MTLSMVDLNLPWSCAENGASIVDADGAPACYGLSIDETPLIVRAVNCHAVLVEGLKIALDLIETRYHPGLEKVIKKYQDLLASLE